MISDDLKAGIVILRLAFLYLVVIAGMLTGCSTPAERVTSEATRLGFTPLVVDGTEFKHQVYLNHAQGQIHGATLHVYLEGDGTPWIHRDWIASDPTPRRPLMLRLMALDTAPSIYLGRPCYHGYASTHPCNPALWTDARYSQQVIDSMVRALNTLVGVDNTGSLMFFGHSGGGTLAMLLAERFPQTRAVVTIAGNLDIDLWAKLHGYTKMQQSMNPADRPALDKGISQLHLIGEDDTNITPQLIQEVESRQENSELVVVTDFDHICCWQELWPNILEWVSTLESSVELVRKGLRLN